MERQNVERKRREKKNKQQLNGNVFGLDISHFLSFVVHLIKNCTRNVERNVHTKQTANGLNGTETRTIHKMFELLMFCILLPPGRYILKARAFITFWQCEQKMSFLEQSVSKMWHILLNELFA